MYAPECGVCMRAQKPQGLGSILDFATDGGVHLGKVLGSGGGNMSPSQHC